MSFWDTMAEYNWNNYALPKDLVKEEILLPHGGGIFQPTDDETPKNWQRFSIMNNFASYLAHAKGLKFLGMIPTLEEVDFSSFIEVFDIAVYTQTQHVMIHRSINALEHVEAFGNALDILEDYKEREGAYPLSLKAPCIKSELMYGLMVESWGANQVSGGLYKMASFWTPHPIPFWTEQISQMEELPWGLHQQYLIEYYLGVHYARPMGPIQPRVKIHINELYQNMLELQNAIMHEEPDKGEKKPLEDNIDWAGAMESLHDPETGHSLHWKNLPFFTAAEVPPDQATFEETEPNPLPSWALDVQEGTLGGIPIGDSRPETPPFFENEEMGALDMFGLSSEDVENFEWDPG